MTFNQEIFKQLSHIYSIDTPCITIYLPTFRAGHVQEDKIRYKNALTEARDQLVAGDMLIGMDYDKKEADKLLQPAYQLLLEDEFWLRLSDGLAIFIHEGRFEYYTVPIHFKQFVYVGHEFYLRHMLPLIEKEDRFFLLAMSQHKTRFFECHQYSITPVRIEDLMPVSRKELLPVGSPSLQYHTDGGEQAIYHGHGGGKDQEEEQLQEYLRKIDKGLLQMLHDESAPMIIAAVDYLVPAYREISRYPHITDIHISGNHDETDPILLHEKAWALMAPKFDHKKREKLNQFMYMKAQHQATSDISDIVKQAKAGKIDTLFISAEADIKWGYHKTLTSNAVEIDTKQAAHNTCLYNYAATQTWRNGGRVFSVSPDQLPDKESEMNAIMRY